MVSANSKLTHDSLLSQFFSCLFYSLSYRCDGREIRKAIEASCKYPASALTCWLLRWLFVSFRWLVYTMPHTTHPHARNTHARPQAHAHEHAHTLIYTQMRTHTLDRKYSLCLCIVVGCVLLCHMFFNLQERLWRRSLLLRQRPPLISTMKP